MAKPYLNNLASTTAQVPYVPAEWLNESPDYSPVTETITVPASLKIELNHAISVADPITVTVASVAKTPIAYGTTPGSTEVAVQTSDNLPPIVQFHSSANGLSASITYTPIATQLSAGRMNQHEKQLELVTDQSHEQDTDTGTDSDTFTVDSDSYSGGINTEFEGVVDFTSFPTINFGNQLYTYHDGSGLVEDETFNAYLQWLGSSGRFEFSQPVYSQLFQSLVFSGTTGAFTNCNATSVSASNLSTTYITSKPTIRANEHTQLTLAPNAATWNAGMELIANGQTGMHLGQLANAGNFLSDAAAGDFYLRVPTGKAIRLGSNTDATQSLCVLSNAANVLRGTTTVTALSTQSGTDVYSLVAGAPTSGTNRISLDLAKPSGGTTNYSMQAAGTINLNWTASSGMTERLNIGALHSIGLHSSGPAVWFNGNSWIFSGSGRNLGVSNTSSGTVVYSTAAAADANAFTIQASTAELRLKTLANNKDIVLTPHGTGTIKMDGVTSNVRRPVATKSAAYTVTTSDYMIIAQLWHSDFNITLPLASTCAGQEFFIVGDGSPDYAVNIITSGSDNIRTSAGGSTTTLPVGDTNQTHTLVSSGSAWFIKSQYA